MGENYGTEPSHKVETKDCFSTVSGISHDLITPLNAIIGFSEILLDASSGFTAEQREMLEYIHESGQKLHAEIVKILERLSLPT